MKSINQYFVPIIFVIATLLGTASEIHAACEPEGCYSAVTFDAGASDCDTLVYHFTIQDAFSGDTGTSCNDITDTYLPIPCDEVSLVTIDADDLSADPVTIFCSGNNLLIQEDLENDGSSGSSRDYDIIVELKHCMCQQQGPYNLEEEFSDGNSNGGPSCDHPQPPQMTTGPALCQCGDNVKNGEEECDGSDLDCPEDFTCNNDTCLCVPPPTQIECGQEEVDLLIMIDRTGSVSDTEGGPDDLAAEGNAVKTLLQKLIDSGNTNIHVAIGRFPAEEDGTPTTAGMLTTFGAGDTDYATLQTIVDNHFVNHAHGDYEGSAGGTNLFSANDLAFDILFASNPLRSKVYILFSDGDTNDPVDDTADHDARVSANQLKDAGVKFVSIAFDASGATAGTPGDCDSTSDGGDGGGFSGAGASCDAGEAALSTAGDVINRRLMAEMATSADSAPPRGLDGCGGDACTPAEEAQENNLDPLNPDTDDFYIKATGDGLNDIVDELIAELDCPVAPDLDGNACTPNECLDNGFCGSGAIMPGCQPCEEDADCNTPDLCDAQQICVIEDGETSGKCADDPNHTPVDCSNDPNLCDGTLACNPATGNCENGTPPPPCDDGQVCTNEVCNPATGLCDTSNNSNPCSDNNACTQPDVCGGGSCQPGAPLSCEDSNACTNNDCNSNTGCVNTPIVCNDGLTCTVDGCDPASGCTTTPLQCPDDGNICTDPTCTEPAGCGHVNNNHSEPCYTGPDGTNGVGLCHGGTKTCSGGAFGACIGEVLPETEVCDGFDNDCNGVVDDGGNALCDDGDACNGPEVCADQDEGGVSCQEGDPPSCDDEDACTDDSCTDNQCQHTPDLSNEGCEVPPTCPDGVCDATSGETCGNCVEDCGQCPPTPVDEICGDGIDNNLDGSIDEGCASATTEAECASGGCFGSGGGTDACPILQGSGQGTLVYMKKDPGRFILSYSAILLALSFLMVRRFTRQKNET